MKSFIKQLLKEGLDKKQYLGQCDSLRRKCTDNEAYWGDMMKNKSKISFNDFIHGVNMSNMLDSDETPKEYIKDSIKNDPTTAAYISKWGDKDCMFLQTAGFEFIFI